MNTQNGKVNLLPAILILVGVVVLVFIGSLFAFEQETDTIQARPT